MTLVEVDTHLGTGQAVRVETIAGRQVFRIRLHWIGPALMAPIVVLAFVGTLATDQLVERVTLPILGGLAVLCGWLLWRQRVEVSSEAVSIVGSLRTRRLARSEIVSASIDSPAPYQHALVFRLTSGRTEVVQFISAGRGNLPVFRRDAEATANLVSHALGIPLETRELLSER